MTTSLTTISQPRDTETGRHAGFGLGPAQPRKRALRIMITSAGRRVGLVQCFRAAAAELGVELELLACDLRPDRSPACLAADIAFQVPQADDPSYADAVLAICAEHHAALVIPTIDPELLPLSRRRDDFEAIDVDVAVSDPELVEIARDKLATARFLAVHGIPSPRTALMETRREYLENWRWPLICKPRHGSASRGLRVAAAPQDLPDIAASEPFVVQELLAGTEFTVNMYFDRDGSLRCTIPHERLQVRAGEVEKGRTRRIAQLAEIARRMAPALPKPRGALCFQAILGRDGSASVFEINARFGGGYPLADHAGAKFARWLIEARLGLPSTASDEWREDVTMLRYDAAVFVEP